MDWSRATTSALEAPVIGKLPGWSLREGASMIYEREFIQVISLTQFLVIKQLISISGSSRSDVQASSRWPT